MLMHDPEVPAIISYIVSLRELFWAFVFKNMSLVNSNISQKPATAKENESVQKIDKSLFLFSPFNFSYISFPA